MPVITEGRSSNLEQFEELGWFSILASVLFMEEAFPAKPIKGLAHVGRLIQPAGVSSKTTATATPTPTPAQLHSNPAQR